MVWICRFSWEAAWCCPARYGPAFPWVRYGAEAGRAWRPIRGRGVFYAPDAYAMDSEKAISKFVDGLEQQERNLTEEGLQINSHPSSTPTCSWICRNPKNDACGGHWSKYWYQPVWNGMKRHLLQGHHACQVLSLWHTFSYLVHGSTYHYIQLMP